MDTNAPSVILLYARVFAVTLTPSSILRALSLQILDYFVLLGNLRNFKKSRSILHRLVHLRLDFLNQALYNLQVALLRCNVERSTSLLFTLSTSALHSSTKYFTTSSGPPDKQCREESFHRSPPCLRLHRSPEGSSQSHSTPPQQP